jgi:hypothetical protein
MASGSAVARTSQLSPSSPASSQHSLNTATDNQGVAKDTEQHNSEKRAREAESDRDVQPEESEDSDEDEDYSDPEAERVSVVLQVALRVKPTRLLLIY